MLDYSYTRLVFASKSRTSTHAARATGSGRVFYFAIQHATNFDRIYLANIGKLVRPTKSSQGHIKHLQVQNDRGMSPNPKEQKGNHTCLIRHSPSNTPCIFPILPRNRAQHFGGLNYNYMLLIYCLNSLLRGDGVVGLEITSDVADRRALSLHFSQPILQ